MILEFLKSRKSISEAKEHNNKLKVAMMSSKCSLKNIMNLSFTAWSFNFL